MPHAGSKFDRPDPLLEIRGLSVGFETTRGMVRPVRDVYLTVYPGQTVAVVGESGCGKSVTALSILRLIPHPPGHVLGGQIMFQDRDLLALNEKEMQRVRGKDIAMIFQEPMTSLNPVFTIGEQIMEAVILHQHVSRAQAFDIAAESLRDVGIADAKRRLSEYPHQMSGGMRQRVMIAMALSCQPKLLIADEPTTALDVTIQAQILELLRKLQAERGMSILLITHDLGVVAENADVVAVMYASRVVEFATVEDLFDHPQHPYTEGLFLSVPKLGGRKERLDTIPGTVPNPARFPSGCKFHPRCTRTRAAAAQQLARASQMQQDAKSAGGAIQLAADVQMSPPGEQELISIRTEGESARVVSLCVNQEPELHEVRPSHWAACHLVPRFQQSPITVPRSDHRREVIAAALDGAGPEPIEAALPGANLTGTADPEVSR